MTKEERLKAAGEWLEISKCDFTYPEAYALTNREVEDYATERAKEAFIKGAEAEAESKWISVEDRFPENRQQVIFYRNNISEGYFLGVYKHGVFHQDLIMYSGVTHWQPMPQPPLNQQ